MHRISGFTLLAVCLLCLPSFSPGQALDRAPAPIEKKALEEPPPKILPAPSTPAVKTNGAARPTKTAQSPQVKPKGSLIKQGNRLFFRLDRPATRMEIYAGKRKLGQLGGGLQFDLTPYLDKTGGGKLTLKYADASSRQYSEDVETGSRPAQIKVLVPKTPAPRPIPGTPPPPPNIGTILFNAPKAGDFLVQGTDFEIRLQGQGDIPEPCYGIYLYRGSTQVMHVVLQKCGPSHTWHVPTNLSGSDFRLRVITLDSNIMAESAPFAILSAAPDLTVTNVSINPSSPDTADTITFRGTVSNAGLTRADGVRAVIKVTAPDNAETTYNVTLSGMALGDHRLVQKSFRLPKAGQYSVSLTAEVTLATALEARLDNNAATVACPVAGLPDLRVCLHQIRNVQIDHWEYIDVRVENIGEANSSSTTLAIWIDGRGTETLQVPGLIPGSHNMGSRYEMWISRNPSRDYKAVVDPNNTVRESHEDNNQKTGVIVKHLTEQADTNYSCAGLVITGYPVIEVP